MSDPVIYQICPKCSKRARVMDGSFLPHDRLGFRITRAGGGQFCDGTGLEWSKVRRSKTYREIEFTPDELKARADRRRTQQQTSAERKKKRDRIRRAAALSALFACLFAIFGCVPAVIRAGPRPLSLQPVKALVAGVERANAAQLAEAGTTAVALGNAVRIAAAPKIEGKALYQLRIQLGAAEAANARLTLSLRNTTAELGNVQTDLDGKEAEAKENAEAYKAAATAEWKKVNAKLWKSRIFGHPIAFTLGMATAGVLGFIFRAGVRAFLGRF